MAIILAAPAGVVRPPRAASAIAPTGAGLAVGQVVVLVGVFIVDEAGARNEGESFGRRWIEQAFDVVEEIVEDRAPPGLRPGLAGTPRVSMPPARDTSDGTHGAMFPPVS
jgi:hypothetical protein